MKCTIKQLYDDPITRIMARLSRGCTVRLSTGKEIYFDKPLFGEKVCVYDGTLKGQEEEEFMYAGVLMGM